MLLWWAFTKQSLSKDLPLPLYHYSDLSVYDIGGGEEKVDPLGTQQPLGVRALGYKERGLVQF